MNQDDIRTLNELKMLSIDMITRANSGSPGLVLSMAPTIYTLFAKHLMIKPDEPNWINRDRVVLSSGNASSILYAILYLAGYQIRKEDLMNYCRLGSITPGYPEYRLTPGIDISTGLFGEGIAMGVGIALARKIYQNIIDEEDDRIKLLDFNTYCICTDRDMMEGCSEEALSFASTQKLDHFILLYIHNNMLEDGSLEMVKKEEMIKKYQAMGFYVDDLKDGTNVKEIDKAIQAAKKSGRPAILILKAVLGKESFNENKNITYRNPLPTHDVANLRKKWNLFLPPFEVSKDSMIFLQKSIQERTEKKYNKWMEFYHRANQNLKIKEMIDAMMKKQLNLSFDSEHYKINDGYCEPLIETNRKVINMIAPQSNLFLGCSADSIATCQTLITQNDLTDKNKKIRNLLFGLREHAMGSILNGMAVTGLKGFGSTKLIYADYMKPAIRMTAYMNLPVTYIFTHDTISVGEEGPIIQPIEQLSMLHTTPNLVVYRPADVLEVMGSWENIIKRNIPAALIITQNNSPKLPNSNAKMVSKGAYIIKQEKNRLDGILISCGSELPYTLQIAYDLEKNGFDLRVVSMPSMELFLGEGKEYEEFVLPKSAKKIVIEASSPLLWNRFVNNSEMIIGINDFGYSGHPNEVLLKMGFDYESLKNKVENLLK